MLMSTTTTVSSVTPRSSIASPLTGGRRPSSGREYRSYRSSDLDFSSCLPPTPPTPHLSGEFYDKFDPRVKKYTPGPGSYQPSWDRKGHTKMQSYSFGGSDRSYIKASVSTSCSPGPKYKFGVGAKADKRSSPAFTVSRDGKWQRSFTNSPCHNPGPGHYVPKTTQKGRGDLTDAPVTIFGKDSHSSPEESLLKTVYLGPGHEVENHGVFSPGPVYYPDKDRYGKAEYGNRASSMRPRLKVPTLPYGYSYKEFRHHGQEGTPAPGEYDYKVSRKGGGYLGDAPHFTFRGKDFLRAEENISTVPFVSEFHSKIDNHGIYSPGPSWYNPEQMEHRLPPNFDSGPDRFYDRFEPGRLIM
mmetsp:Transcript_42553/g.136527  ORF Transcript_42553/g.136527 Transcript_42553/m.136527 type:complete len:356 (-) Transcript_42553:215-1282(-)